ncbi:MAG: peptidylprolyl isomerase [Flavobacteriales bacterium]
MRLIRNIAVFCIVITSFACSGLRKSEKTPKESIVKVTTSMGEMYIELSDKTPKHKANFLKLAKEGFYDSTLFHRVIGGFMVQGGDPQSKGAKPGKALGNGGPGYTIPAEFNTTLFHKKGALAAARMGDNVNPKKNSSGSQFYLVQGKKYTVEQLKALEIQKRNTEPGWNMESVKGFKFSKAQLEAYTTVGGTPFLDAGYTVYGQVIKGLDVIDKIAKVAKDKQNRPNKDVMMKMEVLQLSAKEKMKLLEK